MKDIPEVLKCFLCNTPFLWISIHIPGHFPSTMIKGFILQKIINFLCHLAIIIFHNLLQSIMLNLFSMYTYLIFTPSVVVKFLNSDLDFSKIFFVISLYSALKQHVFFDFDNPLKREPSFFLFYISSIN